jgi:hypothetical protein
MGIQYYGLAKDEKPPSEFCAIRHEHGEPSEYHWYIPEPRVETDDTGYVTRVKFDGRWYVPEWTCKPHGEWERVSQTQEVRRLVCDCGEELGMEERGTLPWRYHHRASLPNYCPECGARIEVEE